MLVGAVLEESLEVDVDAALAQVLDDPAGLCLADLGHDAAEGLDEDEADVRLGEGLVLGDRGAHDVLEFGEELDAREAAADEDEGERLAAFLVVLHEGGVGETGEEVVAQGHGFLDPLEADRVLLETGDRQGAGDGAGGHDDVVVVELEGLVVLGFDDDELVGVVDRRHLAGDDLGAGQVAARGTTA